VVRLRVLPAGEIGVIELRRCWWCKNFDIDLGERDYSEYTPGYPGYARCSEKHYIDKERIFESVKQAEECPDYERDGEK
jgi:hypothetical protein